MVKLRILRCSRGDYSFRRRYISVFWKPTWWKEGSGSRDISLGTETKVHLAHNIIWNFRFLLRTVYVLGRKVSPGRVIFCMWAGLSWKTGSSLANRPRAFILFSDFKRIWPAVLRDRHSAPRREESALWAWRSCRISSHLHGYGCFLPDRLLKSPGLQFLATKWLFTALQLVIYFNHYLILKTLVSYKIIHNNRALNLQRLYNWRVCVSEFGVALCEAWEGL